MLALHKPKHHDSSIWDAFVIHSSITHHKQHSEKETPPHIPSGQSPSGPHPQG